MVREYELSDNLTSSRPPGNFRSRLRVRTWKPKRGYWKTGEEGNAATGSQRNAYMRAKYLETLSYVHLLR